MKSHIAEFVSPGHPDRLADAIVESIVDLAVGRDADAIVGVECAVHTDHVFIDGRIAAGRAACPHAAVAGVLRYGCMRRVGDNAPYQFCDPIAKTNTRRRGDTPPCRNAFKRARNADCAAFSDYMRGGVI